MPSAILSSSRPKSIDSKHSDTFLWPDIFEFHQPVLASFQQSIPSDIITSDESDSDTCNLTSGFSPVFDPTSLEVGFDQACLDGLDDILLNSPNDAFASVCWEEATNRSAHSSLPEVPAVTVASPVVPEPPFTDGNRLSSASRTAPVPPEVHQVVIGPDPVIHTLPSMPLTMVDKESISAFEPRFDFPASSDAIGLFPIPSNLPRKGRFSRIGNTYSNLSVRLLKFKIPG